MARRSASGLTRGFERTHLRRDRDRERKDVFGANCSLSKKTQALVMRLGKQANLSAEQLRQVGAMAPRNSSQAKPKQHFSVAGGARGKRGAPPRSKAVVSVPKVGTAKSKQHSSTGVLPRFRSGRRTKQAINQSHEQCRLHREEYRPMPCKPIATDTEKRRLQAQFTFKGGKVLPAKVSVAPIAGHIPLHLITGKKANRAGSKTLRNRSSKQQQGKRGGKQKGSRASYEQMFDQLLEEIEHRKSRIDQLHKAAAARTGGRMSVKEQVLERTLQNEIRSRVNDMEKIDKFIKEEEEA